MSQDKNIVENNAYLVYLNAKLKDKLTIAINGLKAIAESGATSIAQKTLDEIDKHE
tara:strand:+ start:355 stop:522 length:168 start_codon:yes stop_codon:yes gene_type:complete